MNRCEHCESNKVKIIFGSMYLCNDCYNELMVEDLEVELEPLIESFSLKDYQGTSRTFSVERRLYPTGIFLEASENIEYGYKFAVHGELNCNQQELLNKLIAKARRGTSTQQVKNGVFPNGQTYHTIINNQITGLIQYDETSDDTPLVIVDGKPFTWDELGKMLMSYEGFQFKIKTYDLTDDAE
ncbi:DUF7713 domain-containing protein [Fredinandcohnia onubensis]|uniref:DUF7713 domain-containing protein n=1 Tax=Fredinandcohnia onubensis TaxID=1571209 RepID=UPI000C0BF71E